jgi:hypothetical protein
MKYADVAENVKKRVEQPHHNHTVDRLYRSKPFTSDEERLEHLLELYEEIVEKEQLVYLQEKSECWKSGQFERFLVEKGVEKTKEWTQEQNGVTRDPYEVREGEAADDS